MGQNEFFSVGHARQGFHVLSRGVRVVKFNFYEINQIFVRKQVIRQLMGVIVSDMLITALYVCRCIIHVL